MISVTTAKWNRIESNQSTYCKAPQVTGESEARERKARPSCYRKLWQKWSGSFAENDAVISNERRWSSQLPFLGPELVGGDTTSCAALLRPPQYAPPPASGDLNSHQERPGDLDLWSLRAPRVSMMRDIVLHPIPSSKIAGLPVPKMWLLFGHGVKRPGDLDLWPFCIGTGAEGQRWHGQPNCQFWCLCRS